MSGNPSGKAQTPEREAQRMYRECLPSTYIMRVTGLTHEQICDACFPGWPDLDPRPHVIPELRELAMTAAELLAREVIRLDSRGGCDTEGREDFNEDEWPSEAAVRVALNVVADAEHVRARWARRVA